jgi:hypothetical protein
MLLVDDIENAIATKLNVLLNNVFLYPHLS